MRRRLAVLLLLLLAAAPAAAFKVSLAGSYHEDITLDGLRSSGLSSEHRQTVRRWVVEADRHQWASQYHYDDCNWAGAQGLQTKLWNDMLADAAKFVSTGSDGKDVVDDAAVLSCLRNLGNYLHVSQDFYAHTNWVEMHADRGQIPVPLYPSADFSGLPTPGLVSGYFSIRELGASPQTLESLRAEFQKETGKAQIILHYELNKDQPEAPASKRAAGGTTMFLLALDAATRETTRQWERLVAEISSRYGHKAVAALRGEAAGGDLQVTLRPVDAFYEQDSAGSFTIDIAGGRAPFEIVWTSDEGHSGSDARPSISFRKPGTRTVSAKVKDSSGQEKSHQVSVKVRPSSANDLKVSVDGPRVVEQGDQVQFTFQARDGMPPYRHEWRTPNATSTNQTLDGRFADLGTTSVTVAVWDQGTFETVSKDVSVSVEVVAPLEVQIEGQTQVPVGSKLAFNAVARGGYGKYRYEWITPKGSTQRQAIEGKASTIGEYDIRLRVWDEGKYRTTPKEVSTRLRITAGADIEFGPLEISPTTVDAGGTVTVKVPFRVRNFGDPVMTAKVYAWMEASSGSGLGTKQETTQNVPQDQWLSWSPVLPTNGDAKAGPIQIQVQVTVAGYSEMVTGQATIRGGPPPSATLQDVTVDSRQISFRIWDHGSEDGDVVNVYLNGQAFMSGATMTNAGFTYTLNLNPGPNQLVIQALTNGSNPPNSAAIAISNVVRGPASQTYLIEQGNTATFQIIAP